MKIEGCVAVVTGAGRGIGKAYCHALLQEGATVCFGDILEEEGRHTEAEFHKQFGDKSAIFMKCDVTKQEDVNDLFQTANDLLGDITISINNAAVIHELNWELPLNVNLGGVIRCTTVALDYMGKDKGGKGGVVINTGSVSSLYPDYWGPVYSATKHGVLAFTRALAMEPNYSQTAVRLNSICPSNVDTDFSAQVTHGRARHVDLKQGEICDGAALRPSQIAEEAISLIKDDSANGVVREMYADAGTFTVEFRQPPYSH